MTLTAAFVALALPAAASAFQTVTIENGILHIVGDKGKLPDQVTITYDSVKEEYVIGHDVDMVTAPPGCTFEGPGPPYKILHCPAKGIGRIKVELGNGKDSFQTRNIIYYVGFGAPKSFVPQDLVGVDVEYGPDNDSMVQEVPSLPPPRLGRVGWWASASAGSNLAVENIDMGTGNDKAIVEGQVNTIIFGGSGKLTAGDGTNTVNFGDGNSQVTVGNGLSTIRLGNGNSRVTVGDGTNTVKFGAGNSRFTGGDGADIARFGRGKSSFTGGGGNDKAKFKSGDNNFSGGPGNDKAKLGAGDDTGSGGPGKDKLIGGAGNDHLFGNGGFDLLKGGGGRSDQCFAGGGGAKLVGCEKP